MESIEDLCNISLIQDAWETVGIKKETPCPDLKTKDCTQPDS